MSTPKDQPQPQSQTFAQPLPAAEPRKIPKNIPTVEKTGTSAGSLQPKTEDYEGEYIRQSDGEPYAMAVMNDPVNGRSHYAQNSEHYWNGTPEQFAQQFKEKGSKDEKTADQRLTADLEDREKARKEFESQVKKTDGKSKESKE